MIYGKQTNDDTGALLIVSHISDDPAAEKTCEDLLNLAVQIDPGNNEALQTLASVRLSQERPDDAKVCLEQAWVSWKDMDLGLCTPCPVLDTFAQ